MKMQLMHPILISINFRTNTESAGFVNSILFSKVISFYCCKHVVVAPVIELSFRKSFSISIYVFSKDWHREQIILSNYARNSGFFFSIKILKTDRIKLNFGVSNHRGRGYQTLRKTVRNEWLLLTIVFNHRGNLQMYFDMVRTKVRKYGNYYSRRPIEQYSNTIGSILYRKHHPFIGCMSHIMVFPFMLGQNQIKDLYEKGNQIIIIRNTHKVLLYFKL
jgi:hypothetical protein